MKIYICKHILVIFLWISSIFILLQNIYSPAISPYSKYHDKQTLTNKWVGGLKKRIWAAKIVAGWIFLKIRNKLWNLF